MNLAPWLEGLSTDAVRQIFERASRMKNPVDLSVGLPDFEVPERIRKAAVVAIEQGRNRYTSSPGISELRRAIEQALKREGVPFGSVIATSGATGGLISALLALADHSTEVLLTDPCFVTYPHMVALARACTRWIDTYPDFRLTPERIEATAAVVPAGRRKILIFNSPVNPTGIAYTAEEIARLAATTRRLGIQVISDEVYDLFSYDFPHECWLKHDPGAVLVRTFGKTWAVTGWRCGYAAGPVEIIEAMIAVQQILYVCVPTPAQWAAIEALNTDMTHQRDLYRRKRDLAHASLSREFSVHRPQGAFYAFAEAPGGNAVRFLEECWKREVLVVPGEAFSRKGTHFRVSFALSDDRLAKGLVLLADAARAFRA